jgi:hypothetical protein
MKGKCSDCGLDVNHGRHIYRDGQNLILCEKCLKKIKDMYNYPTNDELVAIERWDFKTKSVKEFLEYIRSLWWNPHIQFILKGKRVLYLQLHTGGWSGNEEIIQYMKNTRFWMAYWRVHKVGGHYYFKIKL